MGFASTRHHRSQWVCISPRRTPARIWSSSSRGTVRDALPRARLSRSWSLRRRSRSPAETSRRQGRRCGRGLHRGISVNGPPSRHSPALRGYKRQASRSMAVRALRRVPRNHLGRLVISSGEFRQPLLWPGSDCGHSPSAQGVPNPMNAQSTSGCKLDVNVTYSSSLHGQHPTQPIPRADRQRTGR